MNLVGRDLTSTPTVYKFKLILQKIINYINELEQKTLIIWR